MCCRMCKSRVATGFMRHVFLRIRLPQVPGWPELPFPFSEGVLHCTECEQGGSSNKPCTLKISGNQGFDFVSQPPGLVPGGISNQTKYAMMDIQSIVEAASAKMDDVTSCTVWLRDIADFGAMNDVYKCARHAHAHAHVCGRGPPCSSGGDAVLL